MNPYKPNDLYEWPAFKNAFWRSIFSVPQGLHKDRGSNQYLIRVKARVRV